MTAKAAKTEAEWRAYRDPRDLLHKLGDQVNPRKLRLFACACCRQMPEVQAHVRYQQVVEVVERYADGQATGADMQAALSEAHPPACTWVGEALGNLKGFDVAGSFAAPNLHAASEHAARAVRDASGALDWSAARRRQVALLCDLIGDLIHHPALDPAWLRRNNETARKVARAIYEDHGFGDLPVLADALEEAGCSDAVLLDHCRRPGDHVRGCWVVDFILAKDR